MGIMVYSLLCTLNYGNYGIFLITLNYGNYGIFLITLNYGNYGIFFIMGHAAFCPSTVLLRHRQTCELLSYRFNKNPENPIPLN